MRIRFEKDSGSTLLVTVVIAGVIGLALVSYLSLAFSHSHYAARSEAWNAALPVAEAGLEEAIAHLMANGTNLSADGWTVSTNECSKQRAFGDGFYLVTMSGTNPVTVTSVGSVRAPLQDNLYISRTVQVTAQQNIPLSGALIVRDYINLNGNNVLTDSFDSTNPLKSVSGQYVPAVAGAKGDVIAMGGMINSPSNSFTIVISNVTYTFFYAVTNIAAGNGNVWGHVHTGPLGGLSLAVSVGAGLRRRMPRV